MSEKRVDEKKRWRNKVVAFRMSPQEAEELDVQVSLSGLSKQDYLIQCCLQHGVRVVCGRKVARQMQMYLEGILEELQFSESEEVAEEIIIPLKHILAMLDKESEVSSYGTDNI